MIFIEEDQGACERYSIYRSALFGNDLLWEGTACEEECVQLKGRFEEKLEMYNEVYGSGCVYSEHVNYTSDF
jgi:hypothetical protein